MHSVLSPLSVITSVQSKSDYSFSPPLSLKALHRVTGVFTLFWLIRLLLWLKLGAAMLWLHEPTRTTMA